MSSVPAAFRTQSIDRILIDVSNTIESGRASGLQRLAVEISGALDELADEGIGPPVALLDGRSGRLRMLPVPARARLSRRNRPASRTAQVGGRIESRLARLGPMSAAWQPSAGDLLLDVEPSWHAPQPRSSLLPLLRRAGVPSAAVVPDLLPITNPEWFTVEAATRFSSWFDAHVAAESRLLAISHATASAISASTGSPDGVSVIRLGDTAARQPQVDDGLILMIGTIEPRKGHDVLLDALDELGAEAPTIDVVGQQGWNSEDVAGRLRQHRSVRWHEALDDAALDDLWRRASLLVQPTRGEGFGLPVAEALQRGVPVIASDLAVLRESSQGQATFVDVGNASAWAEVLRRWRAEREQWPRPRSPTSVSWRETAEDVLGGLLDR